MHGALWQLTTLGGVFLFHYIEDILVSSQFLSDLEGVALCLWLI